MTILTPRASPTDADLVARSLHGDRDAYAAIVARHQSAICALTYATCGDLHQSQDLAQETFLAAWRDLATLKDPAYLLAWLRGIARNLSRNAARKDRRSPEALSDLAADDIATTDPAPPDAAITREEETLVWQNLSRLPEAYREPLVLFYRERQSVSAVAAALDLSEPAARQRLSRGRALLAERLEHLLDRTLRQSAPGPAFTLSVTASLPAVTASHAALATAAKTTASTKAATLATTFLGPLISFAALYVTYRIGRDQFIAPEERLCHRRAFRITFVIAFAFTLILLGVIYGTRALGFAAGTTTGLIGALTATYVAAILAVSVIHTRRLRRIRRQLLAARPELAAEAERATRPWTLHYRSPWRFLGLPLLDVNIGSAPDLRSRFAAGWIAVGTTAYSPIVAVGAIAVAPLSWGAFSLGLLTYGVFAVGAWSVGVVAIGHDAVGVCALASHAAQGVVALAPAYADGIAAAAAHVSDDAAEAFFGSHPLFRVWALVTDHAVIWLWLLPLVPTFLLVRRARRIRRAVS